MEKSSENNFEQQWKQKFNKASVPPPPDMWHRIESDLDEKSGRKPLLLIWGVPAYVVSGIAATLILAIGGWFLLSESAMNTMEATAENQPSENVEQLANKPSVQKEQKAATKAAGKSRLSGQQVAERTGSDNVTMSNTSSSRTVNNDQLFAETTFQTKPSVEVFSANQTTISEQATEPIGLLKKFTSTLSKLAVQSYEEYPVRYILKRNKLAYVEPFEAAAEPVKEKRRSWVGLISGLSPFKPNFQNGGLNQLASANVNAYSSNDTNFNVQRGPQGAQGPVGPMEPGAESSSFAIPTGTPMQQFTNGRAFNLGIQAGKQLTKRLSLESGVRYIQGNSPVNTNVYTLNEQTGEVNAFVQDYITQDRTLNNAIVAPAETLNNSYEYLSVPVQLAYGIPLLNKLNVEITGGVSADMFLQNTLQSETTDVASLNASNSSYRTLGMSGLGGVRLNYVLDDRWELTVGSAFQQALVSNFESGTSAKLRPQMLGVNYGVNYHF